MVTARLPIREWQLITQDMTQARDRGWNVTLAAQDCHGGDDPEKQQERVQQRVLIATDPNTIRQPMTVRPRPRALPMVSQTFDILLPGLAFH